MCNKLLIKKGSNTLMISKTFSGQIKCQFLRPQIKIYTFYALVLWILVRQLDRIYLHFEIG